MKNIKSPKIRKIKPAVAVMGWPDDLKLRSCMTLFANACEDNGVFLKVLEKYYGGKPDGETLKILRSQAESGDL